MTQHWTSCPRCGYTAPKARHELVHELTKANVMQRTLPSRTLDSVTNIGAAPHPDISVSALRCSSLDVVTGPGVAEQIALGERVAAST